MLLASFSFSEKFLLESDFPCSKSYVLFSWEVNGLPESGSGPGGTRSPSFLGASGGRAPGSLNDLILTLFFCSSRKGKVRTAIIGLGGP